MPTAINNIDTIKVIGNAYVIDNTGMTYPLVINIEEKNP